LCLHGVFASEAAVDAYRKKLRQSGNDDIAVWRMGVGQWEALPPTQEPRDTRQWMRNMLKGSLLAFNDRNLQLQRRAKTEPGFVLPEKPVDEKESTESKESDARDVYVKRGEYKEPRAVRERLQTHGKHDVVMQQLQKLRDSGFKIPITVGDSRILNEDEFKQLKLSSGQNSVCQIVNDPDRK
jgi:hypothetical protein